ncbi:MAG: acetyl-CoA hydrolase/transferase C-terminal domain-containing protein [Acidimicrobiales bacterium]
MVAYADGLDAPRSSPGVVAAAAGLADEDVDLLLGWTPEERAWLAAPTTRGQTVIAGYALADAVATGRLGYLPIRLSGVPRLLTDVVRPDVAVVTGVRRGADLAFGMSVGWGPAAAAAAKRVVVEVDADGYDLGGPVIAGNIVATIPRPPPSGPPPVPRPPRPVDREIARQVVAILPDEPTVQVGPGGVAEAIMDALVTPARIWSGVVTDAVARLDKRGLLIGAASAAYAWGGQPLAELAAVGKLALRPVEETHDLTRLSGVERFVGCNTGLQIGLDGTVNIERIGGRLVAGIGGHADFCAAAARSAGGLSVIALPSTARGGASTIVARVETASTPRCDVDVVVTEHGVADLRGLDVGARSRAISAIAAPEHRDRLQAATTNRAYTSTPAAN